MRKIGKYLRQDTWYPGLDLNPEYPEYEVGVLTTGPRLSVLRDPTNECSFRYGKEHVHMSL
jgi:hypothetical protein